MAPRVAVVLSGCGFLDGAEIHESVLTLLALDLRGAAVRCFAPSKSFDVVNHATQESSGETRDVLTEAARICRGKIEDITKAKASDFDAVVLPGGFGAAKNLCTFATEGPSCSVDPGVETFLTQAHASGCVLGFACIAPALCARVFGNLLHPNVTIGNDAGTAQAVQAMGASHTNAPVTDIVVDEANRIVTTPAYMYDARISEVHKGIDAMVERVLQMASASAVA
ncbi:MAG: isoprenoid biosynthesis glyoxalase ElbB [Phycisphaeraceae bacterium]|nr:isoprenoid biosynthesis glyoxalase ElbB [Phycisphaerales bacterium]MCB9858934.1 isoprenoid biosynthesis glyoxalase ElbB [Phycisphaeraceae bacterium]